MGRIHIFKKKFPIIVLVHHQISPYIEEVWGAVGENTYIQKKYLYTKKFPIILVHHQISPHIIIMMATTTAAVNGKTLPVATASRTSTKVGGGFFVVGLSTLGQVCVCVSERERERERVRVRV